RSDCVGLLVGSPTGGDAPPGGSVAAASAAALRAFASSICRCRRAFFSSGVSPAGGAPPDEGARLGGAEGSDVPEEAGTVVPLVELPEGAFPVSAAWLSGVGRGSEASGGGGNSPASVLANPGLGLLSSDRGASVRPGGTSPASVSGGFLVSSVICTRA
ncbi:MAG: hypothetical protein LC672_00455, partial [Acidobacteria bacterium]|nr:hypothetical protein [Acidobacteriota bacterium]